MGVWCRLFHSGLLELDESCPHDVYTKGFRELRRLIETSQIPVMAYLPGPSRGVCLLFGAPRVAQRTDCANRIGVIMNRTAL
jgi:hypothetical protein